MTRSRAGLALVVVAVVAYLVLALLVPRGLFDYPLLGLVATAALVTGVVLMVTGRRRGPARG